MLNVGDQAPEFELPDIGGSVVSLSGALKRGPALAVFFKTSCPTCQLALPFVERLRDHNVIAISQDPAAVTDQFRRTFGLSVPTLLDSSEKRYPVSNAYRLTNVPTLYLIETDRSISVAGMGFSRADLHTAGARFGVEVFQPGEKTVAFKPG